jgi:hypothetical protein
MWFNLLAPMKSKLIGKFRRILVPYHSVKMENKCKQNGHGNADHVERTEINTSADLLLTASGQYSWKVKRMISPSVKNFPYFNTLVIDELA